MVKHTQTIRRQFADELFECVWPFCGIGAFSLNNSLIVWALWLHTIFLFFTGMSCKFLYLFTINIVFFFFFTLLRWIKEIIKKLGISILTRVLNQRSWNIIVEGTVVWEARFLLQHLKVSWWKIMSNLE